MKELVSLPLGGDGGKVAVGVDGPMLELKAQYPIQKILEPIKVNFVDKMKSIIKGDWDDMLIDKAWDEAVKMVSDEKPMIEVTPA